MATRDHVVLVPGFGGFDTLGPLRYYSGVADVLRSGPGAALTVHHFNDLPTASVDARAATLCAWLHERIEHGLFQPAARGVGDGIHLVGHSTGGLDLRAFLVLLHDACKSNDASALRLRDGIRSVQFLSTPHRGTNLAAVAYGLRNVARYAVARPLYELNALLHPDGAHLLAHAVRGVFSALGHPPRGLLRAAVDLGSAFEGERDRVTQAQARSAWFALLQWLDHIASDTSAVDDLHPREFVALPNAPSAPLVARVLQEPAHRASSSGLESVLRDRDETDAFLRLGVRFRSIVTVAPPRTDASRFDLYRILHGLTAHQPVAPLDALRWTVPRLGDDGPPVRLVPSDNDGIVNSVSMVWPDVTSSVAVEADHGDIIGHYADPPPDASLLPRRESAYDLLRSGSGFDHARFVQVWAAVRDFALATPA